MDLRRSTRRLRHWLIARWAPLAAPADVAGREVRPAVSAALATWAGWVFVALDDHARAHRAFRRALRRRPGHDGALTGLTETGLRVGPPALRADPRLGVVAVPAGIAADVVAAAEQQLAKRAADGRAWSRLAGAHRHDGDWEAWEAATGRALAAGGGRDDAEVWFERGYGGLLRGRRAGGFTSDELELVLRSFERTLELDPHHASARAHLVRLAVQHGEWAVALDAAWPEGAGGGPEPAELISRAVAIEAAPPDYWFAVAWRLQAAGRYLDAAAMRERMTLAARTGRRHVAFGRALDDARAASAQGDVEGAQARLRWLAADFPRPHDRLVIAKLGADIALHAGDAEPLRRWAAARALAVDTAAERRFDALIRGRRVAIVGPGVDDANDDDIDRHDVVIRTKLMSGADAPRTDIAYYTDSSAAVLTEQISGALAAGALQLGVVRPTALDLVGDARFPPSQVRVAPFEDAATFQASHFAISRIAYDLLRYVPASITVFRADLFTNPQPYAPAYRADLPMYHALRFVPVTPMYGHDLAADHRFLAGLVAHGLLRGSDRLTEILGLDSAAYLTRVEAARDAQAA